MILHSIIAMDDIFCKNSVNAPMYYENECGVQELFKPDNNSFFSTDPYVYLKKNNYRYSDSGNINNGL